MFVAHMCVSQGKNANNNNPGSTVTYCGVKKLLILKD
jgi:hypothetical protein